MFSENIHNPKKGEWEIIRSHLHVAAFPQRDAFLKALTHRSGALSGETEDTQVLTLHKNDFQLTTH